MASLNEVSMDLDKLDLRDIRKAVGFETQEEFATAAGFTQPGVSRIERTKPDKLQLGTIVKYAAACGMKVKMKLVFEPLAGEETNNARR